MADKHAAAWHTGHTGHTGHADCGCGETHTSVLASIYCAESIETEQRTTHRAPKKDRPKAIVRSID